MKRKTLPLNPYHPTACRDTSIVWGDSVKTYGGYLDKKRKSGATYLMRTIGITL